MDMQPVHMWGIYTGNRLQTQEVLTQCQGAFLSHLEEMGSSELKQSRFGCVTHLWKKPKERARELEYGKSLR